MNHPRSSSLATVLALGVAAFLVACLSILDMFVPQPFDGIVLDPDRVELVVRGVVPGSGAAIAGVKPGDRITGVGRVIVRSPGEVAKVLRTSGIGGKVPYLMERDNAIVEALVELGPHRLATPLYVYACVSGFFFFFIGLFVLVRRPDSSQGTSSRVFFALCTLFMLFMVCGLRPASYSWVDSVVLTTGTLSLLVLPAAFLHFFLVFPRRLRFSFFNPSETWEGSGSRVLAALEKFFNYSPNLFLTLYLLPPLFFVVTLLLAKVFGVQVRFASGAPISSWVLMGDYLVLGLLALLGSLLRAQEGRERRQIATVFIGTVLGITPFLVLGVVFPSLLKTDKYLLWGVVPLIFVPLTFAYAIVRFHFFDIKVIVRRSLLYTVTTAVVWSGYAIAIASFNYLFRGSSLGSSPFFPFVLALVILALFDPLRRRLQEPIDRFFFREVYDSRRAIEEVSEAVVREFSLERLEELLTARLSAIMHLEWAALYIGEANNYRSSSSPPSLPTDIPKEMLLIAELSRQDAPVRLALLEPLKALDPQSREFLESLQGIGARLVVPLHARGSLHGLLALGPKQSEEEFGADDLQLIRTLANQGAVALENARLLRDRTRQLELEKELEIARRVQFSLIPAHLPSPEGWQVAARCVPARQVGGDFYDALPGVWDGSVAYVVGDVSGKSVPGAMLMIAAREILHTAALQKASPEELLRVANQRLYTPQHRLFVALLYICVAPCGRGIYALAGQPAPLLRRANGLIEELPSPTHRLPVGALRDVNWDLCEVQAKAGEVMLIYSDGVTDARNEAGESFGEERLRHALALADGDPTAVVDGVMGAIAEFTASTEAYDDITLLALRWQGIGEEMIEGGA